MDTCIYHSCLRKGNGGKGYCPAHYKRHRLGQDMDAPLRIKNKGEQCINPRCSRPAHSKGYCKNCGRKVEQFGDPNAGKSKGNYSLERRVNHAGYITWYDPTSVHSNASGWVLEHRYEMGEFLGRRLLDSESVHHKDGDRLDNRLSNLELWSKSQPAGQRVEDKLVWAREIIALYDGKKFST